MLGKTVKAGETGITGMEEGHPREQRTVMRDCQPEQQWLGRFGWERKTQPNLGIGWTPGVGDGQGGLACCSS